MKEDKLSTEVLIAPQLAVQRYLDELLQDATLNVDSNAEPTVEDVESQVEESETQPESNEESIVDGQSAHQQQDELVSQEIENEEDIFAAFEFAVAALENESEAAESVEIIEDDQSSIVLVEDITETASSDDQKETAANESVPLEVDAQSLSAVEPASTEVIETQTEAEAAPESDKTKPLPWAESRFECLLFNVGGLKMAVPLIELGGIQKADQEKVTKIFGQPDWFIGVASVNDLRIRTVDTARWVMPNHYKGELHDSFKFIIQLDRSNWGLACEDVAEAISLEPSDVKWRSDRSKRPWLAGTVIKHMCAILDIQGFIELLEDPINGFKAHLK